MAAGGQSLKRDRLTPGASGLSIECRVGWAHHKRQFLVGTAHPTSGTLAEYINRPNLVIQQAPNQLAVAEDHRWAGDLSASIARVTAANLGRELKTGNVRTYPWLHDEEIRY